MPAQICENRLVRGETRGDIVQYCLRQCRTYIAGSWRAASSSDIKINRITGGYTNQLYRVRLNDNVTRRPHPLFIDREPTDVVIKLYQPKHVQNYKDGESERFNDKIVEVFISSLEISPKVYGIFKDGVLQAYVQHENFGLSHQTDEKVLSTLAKVLAQIHQSDVPIKKHENLHLLDIQRMLNYAYEYCNVDELAEQMDLKTLKEQNLISEYNDLLEHLKSIDSPIEFCHNDFRGCNIMLTGPDQKILVCDFECSGYGFRGYDLATILSEWGKRERFLTGQALPNECEQFLKYYIEACDALQPGFKHKPQNTLDCMMKEAKVFVLVYHMFLIGIMIKQKESLIPSMPFDARKNMRQVESLFQRYNLIKERLISDGIF